MAAEIKRTFKFKDAATLKRFLGQGRETLRRLRRLQVRAQVTGKKLVLKSSSPQDMALASDLVMFVSVRAHRGQPISQEAIEAYMKKQSRRSTPNSIEPKTEGQAAYMACLKEHDIVFGLGPAGTGKAQPLYSKVLTPEGWVLMGDIRVGHIICTPDGGTAKVSGVYPQGEKDVYRVWFTDYTYADCCEEHLWVTQTSLDRDAKRDGAVRSLGEIRHSLRYGDKRNHSIPLTEPLDFPEASVNLDPYVLGLLLGDGCFTGVYPNFSTQDAELVHAVSEGVRPLGVTLKYSSKYDYRITGERTGGKVHNQVVSLLTDMGLWGKKSPEKHIPREYLFGSVSQRTALMQGLMDSDGTVSVDGKYLSFTSTSPQLSEGFQHLVQSLGGTAKTQTRTTSYLYKGILREGLLSYRSTVVLPNEIPAFRLHRKASRVIPRVRYFPCRYIDRVELLGKAECQCILVDDLDHLYLTDHFTVTHNTYLAVATALQAMHAGQVRRLILTRPAVEAGEKLGFLPGTFADKVDPYLQPLTDSLNKLVGKGTVARWKKEGKIEIAPLAYMRGRAQPLDAKVATPSGFSSMGQIQEGDSVLGSDGRPTEVLGVYPQGKRKIYEIAFSDGVRTRACGEHLWPVWTPHSREEGKPYTLLQTVDIFEKGRAALYFEVPIALIEGATENRRFVASVTDVGEAETQCIRVAAKDHLYLTDDFIVTHNTLEDAYVILDEAQNCTWQQLVMLLTRLGEGSQAVLTGDISQTDLMRSKSGLGPIVHALRHIEGIGVYELAAVDVVRHPLVARIIEALADKGSVTPLSAAR